MDHISQETLLLRPESELRSLQISGSAIFSLHFVVKLMFISRFSSSPDQNLDFIGLFPRISLSFSGLASFLINQYAISFSSLLAKLLDRRHY